MNAIEQLKNDKSAGLDSRGPILPEALKADSKTTADTLQPLFKKIWEDKESTIVPLTSTKAAKRGISG